MLVRVLVDPGEWCEGSLGLQVFLGLLCAQVRWGDGKKLPYVSVPPKVCWYMRARAGVEDRVMVTRM